MEKLSFRRSVVYGSEDYYFSYDDITAFEYLGFVREKGYLPRSKEGQKEVSNSELRRWLEKGSVRINGCKVRPNDALFFPIDELVFFEGSKSQVTMI